VYVAGSAGRIVAGCLLALLAPVSSFAQEEPDLILDKDLLIDSWQERLQAFPGDACEVAEGCVDAAGTRRIIRFASETANIGMADIVIGNPATNPMFRWDTCRQRYVYDYHSLYRLYSPGGELMSETWKVGVCLLDNFRYVIAPWVPVTPTYTCSNMGLTRGWSDLYSLTFSCQYVDVTDVPDGAYTLRAEVNPLGVLPEGDRSNNVEEFDVWFGNTAGVSHRPDGRMTPGQQLTVAKEGDGIRVFYDTTHCPAADYHLYYAVNSAYSQYTYDDAVCNLGTDGEEPIVLPELQGYGLIWFVVAGADGATGGGHGFDSQNRERPLTGDGFCSVTSTVPFVGCVP
jgi:hypothetical protein